MLSIYHDYKNDDKFYDGASIKSESTIEDKYDKDTDDEEFDFDIISNNKSSIYNFDEKRLKISAFILKKNKEKNIIKNINLKHKYLSIKKIGNILINQFNGMIFGGYIRDILLHNNGAYCFYKEYCKYMNDNVFLIKKKNNEESFCINTSENENIYYLDKKFHNESYINRNTIPNDIDIVLQEEDFQDFLTYLNKNFNNFYTFKIHKNFNEYMKINDPSCKITSFNTIFINLLNPLNNLKTKISYYEYINLDLEIISNTFIPAKIKIQVFTCKKDISKKSVLNILTEGSDFFCNALYYDIDKKINISSKNMKILDNKKIFNSLYKDKIKKKIDIFLQRTIHKNEIIEQVIKQIFERKAIPINEEQLMYKRIKKMKKKHFQVFCNTLYFTKKISNNNHDICIYCRDDIPINEIISMKCCNSFYHIKCMSQICKNIQYKNKIYPCFMCKKNLDLKYIRKYIYV